MTGPARCAPREQLWVLEAVAVEQLGHLEHPWTAGGDTQLATLAALDCDGHGTSCQHAAHDCTLEAVADGVQAGAAPQGATS